MNKVEIERLVKEKLGEEVTPLAWHMMEFLEKQGYLEEALAFIKEGKQG